MNELIAVFAYLLSLTIGSPVTAEPYGGCDEAWQAPTSTGAGWCHVHQEKQ